MDYIIKTNEEMFFGGWDQNHFFLSDLSIFPDMAIVKYI